MSNKSELRKQTLQLLKVLSESENIIQCIKEALVMHEQFSPIALFETISKGKQRCTKSDLKRFLEKHSIQFTQEELGEYMRQNRLDREFAFHEFIDTLIPFNADALRVYKESYLEKLAIKEQDLEVELIYRELLNNQFKFIRSIDVIKNQILGSCRGEIWRVKQLIKTDLVGRSKIREAKKFQEKFDDPKQEVSFIDLRRFLQLHTPTHQVTLLNLMRKLKADNPIKPINLRLQSNLRNMSRSKSRNKSRERGVSRSKSKGNAKVQSNNYEDFKKQLQEEYEAHQSTELKNASKRQSKDKHKTKSATRWKREQKNTDGELLKKLIQTIISQEEIIEKHRRKLYQAKQFNMINLFKVIDQNRNGVVSEDILLKFVNKHSSTPQKSLKGIFDKFAKQKSGLRFHELYSILQPLSKQLVRTVNNKQQDPIPNPFKEKTIAEIVQIIVLTAESLKLIQSIKGEINDKGQDVNELFQYVSLDKQGQITAQDFKRLLDEDEFFTDHKDMKLLFKYFDKRANEAVGKEDFGRFVEM